MFIGCKKGVLLASLFFVLSKGVFADNSTDHFYQLGYDYSQQGKNKEALHWMLKAADEGHVAAQNNIGLSYLHGLGVEKDSNKAFVWFEKAAKQGSSYAQSELAMLLYQQGNKHQARGWWLIAAQQSDEYAQFNLASLLLEQKEVKSAYYWFYQAAQNNHPNAKQALEKLREKYVE